MHARRTVRRLGLTCMLAVLVAVGCREELVAPADGTCPDFCPPEELDVVDSILLDAVTSDSSFAGYVQPYEATSLQVYRDSSDTGDWTSRGVIAFLPFADSLLLAAGDTARGPIVGTDSLRITLSLTERGPATGDLVLRLYRLPVTVDSTTTYASLDSSFTDSTLIATLVVPDSVTTGDVTVTVDSAAFPDLVADGNRAAVGLALETASGYAQLGAIDGSASAQLTRWVKLDSAGVLTGRLEAREAAFDTYLAPPAPPAAAGTREAGGAPSVRTMLRFALPPRIEDSSRVLRATLILVPTEPVPGAPGDSLALVAQGLAADVGAKSPLLTLAPELLAARIGVVPVGGLDTVRLDVTDLVIAWTVDSTLPRALAVRAEPEGTAVARLRFGGAGSGSARPGLHVTFVPPLRLGGR